MTVLLVVLGAARSAFLTVSAHSVDPSIASSAESLEKGSFGTEPRGDILKYEWPMVTLHQSLTCIHPRAVG